MRPKTRLSEISPILDFGLAVPSGQTTRQYFANYSNSPNLGKSTISFVEYDTPQQTCDYSPATLGKQQVDCCILVSHSILPSTQWINSHSFVSGSQRSLQRSMQPALSICMSTSDSLFCLLHRQQINCINHGKNHRSHRANPPRIVYFLFKKSHPPSRLVHFLLNEPAGSLDLGS